MINRETALETLRERGVTPSLMRHALASEAVMGALARRLGEDEELWRMTGLLHDLDFPKTENDPQRHGLDAVAWLAGLLPVEALAAIGAHNGEMNGQKPATNFDFALRCGESVTGLISAAALMRPTGYEGMGVKSVKKKMKDKAFAANVNRDSIRECEKIGLSLDEFLEIAIAAMANAPGE